MTNTDSLSVNQTFNYVTTALENDSIRMSQNILSGMIILGLVAITITLAINIVRKKSSFDEELAANAKGYITTIMGLSSVAFMMMATNAAVGRGVPLGDAMFRFVLLGFIEILMYFWFINSFSKALGDGKLTIRELLFSILLFSAAVYTTRWMQILYYEAAGAVITEVVELGFPKIKVSDRSSVGTIEISAIMLIYSTPMFSAFLALFMVKKSYDDKAARPSKPSRPSSSSTNTSSSSTTVSNGSGSSSTSSSTTGTPPTKVATTAPATASVTPTTNEAADSSDSKDSSDSNSKRVRNRNTHRRPPRTSGN